MRRCAPTSPEGLPAAEAAARFGYTPASLASAVRDFRAGARDFFTTAKPGPKTAPGKDAARPRILELRGAGHSIDEIAEALAAEGAPLNRTGIAEVIAAEGLPRLWRRPDAERGGVRREIQARAGALGFTALPGRAETKLAGLLLVIPDLIALGLPEMVAAAGHPSTPRIPAWSSVLSLLALKLTSTRRVSHVYDIAAGPGAALFAALTALPKATALTTYSYRLEHAKQAAFLSALDKAVLAAGLAGGEALNLDFHAVMHWGEDPVLEKRYVPRRSQRTQLAVTGLGHDQPTLLITNRPARPARQVIQAYAKRMNIEQRLAEAIQSFSLDALAGAVPLNADLDVVLSVLAHTVCAALRRRLPGCHTATPDTLQRRFLSTGGIIENRGTEIVIRLHRRTYSPVLRQASLPETITVPWWDGRTLRYQYT
jgi:hypothetical protein